MSEDVSGFGISAREESAQWNRFELKGRQRSGCVLSDSELQGCEPYRIGRVVKEQRSAASRSARRQIQLVSGGLRQPKVKQR